MFNSTVAGSISDNILPERIHRIYQQLATARSLEPCEHIDLLFGELVRISTTREPEHISRVLGDPIIGAIQENLWRVCGRGEFLLEQHWSRQIIRAADPWAALRLFPYFVNYDKLTRLELGGLRCAGETSPGRILFVGSGPLPLTSIMLARQHGASVSNIDIDTDACRLSEALVARLGLEQKLQIACADILSLSDLGDYDVIILAALVGMRQREKQQLLAHLSAAMRPGALLVVRSSHLLRALLYPRVEVHHLGELEPILELHPHDEIINSLIIARKPQQAAR